MDKQGHSDTPKSGTIELVKHDTEPTMEASYLNYKVLQEMKAGPADQKAAKTNVRMELLFISDETLAAAKTVSEKQFVQAKTNFDGTLHELDVSGAHDSHWKGAVLSAHKSLEQLTHLPELKLTYGKDQHLTGASWKTLGYYVHPEVDKEGNLVETNHSLTRFFVQTGALSVNMDRLNRMPAHIKEDLGLISHDLEKLSKGLPEDGKGPAGYMSELNSGLDTLLRNAREFKAGEFGDNLSQLLNHVDNLPRDENTVNALVHLRQLQSDFKVLVEGDEKKESWYPKSDDDAFRPGATYETAKTVSECKDLQDLPELFHRRQPPSRAELLNFVAGLGPSAQLDSSDRWQERFKLGAYNVVAGRDVHDDNNFTNMDFFPQQGDTAHGAINVHYHNPYVQFDTIGDADNYWVTVRESEDRQTFFK